MDLTANMLNMENWEKQLPKQVEVRTAEVPIQRMIINNQEQVVNGQVCVLVCPVCGDIIQQFQPGVTEAEITLALCTDNEEALKKTFWCSKCGQKLSLMRPLPIDAQYEVEEVAEN